MTREQKIEAAEWLENDTAYLEKWVQAYKDRSDQFMVEMVSKNAATSRRMAEQYRAEAA